MLPVLLGYDFDFCDENDEDDFSPQTGLEPRFLNMRFLVKRLIHSATVVIRRKGLLCHVDSPKYVDCVFAKIDIPEVGIEPTRTFVHWNLSPTP